MTPLTALLLPGVLLTVPLSVSGACQDDTHDSSNVRKPLPSPDDIAELPLDGGPESTLYQVFPSGFKRDLDGL